MPVEIGRNEGRSARALYYVAPRKAELKNTRVSFGAQGAGEHVLVRTLWSGVSRGTERLVFEGLVPAGERERMRAPHQEGEFPFPVKYGYAAVGVVEEGPADLRGRCVFCLHPHQDLFAVSREAVAPLPPSVPPRRAILAANMETALNAIWDGAAAPGARIVIVGAGALGLLIASVTARLPGAEVIVSDIEPARQGVVEALGASFAPPDALDGAEADVVFHASATAPGLAASLAAAGFEARVVEASWYGAKDIAAPLGGAFHSKRLTLISSQVGAVSAAQRARWSRSRRLAKAVALLEDDRLDALITDEAPFGELPEAMPAIFDASPASIVTAVRYDR